MSRNERGIKLIVYILLFSSLVTSALFVIGDGNVTAYVVDETSQEQPFREQTWAGVSQYSDPVKVTSGATVRTRFVLDSDLSQDGDANTVYWLAGYASDADGPPSALAITLAQVSSGWFGPTWGFQLISDAGILHGVSGTANGSHVAGGNEYISLLNILSEPNHEYEVSLGYDPTTGAAAVSILDVTSERTVVSRNFQLHPYEEGLYPGALISTDRADQQVGSIVDFDVESYVDPVKPSWYIMQSHDPGGYGYPVDRIDRRGDAELSVRLGWDDFHGEIILSVVNGDGDHVATVPYDRSGEPVPFVISHLNAGRYVASLSYVDGERVSLLDEKEITVGLINLQVDDIHVEVIDDHRIHVIGALHVESDGPFRDVVVQLEASKLRHTFDYNPLTGEAVFDRLSEEDDVLFPSFTMDVHGETSIQFDVELTLPDESDSNDFWELHIGPVAHVPEYLIGEKIGYSTWTGRSESYVPESPYLHGEVADRRSISPGVDVISMKGRIPAGPIELHLVTADLTVPGVHLGALVGADLKTPGTSRWPRSVPTQLVERSGAVVGVNGDFFEISHSMTPRGIVMRSGELMKAGSSGYVTLGVSGDGTPFIGNWRWVGHISKEGVDGSRRVEGINITQTARGISIFRSPATWTVGTVNVHNPVVELIVEEIDHTDGDAYHIPSDFQSDTHVLRGVVKEVRQGQPKTEVRPGYFIVAGEGLHGQDLLDMFDVGDMAEITFRLEGQTEWPYMADWRQLHDTVSGNVLLLRNGMYGDYSTVMHDKNRHPRTAIGISRDQSKLYVLLVDGRSSRSVGMTYKEMANLFRHIGAFHALNLDGGGSSGLAVRDLLTNTVDVLNVPSDGRQRYVPNGFGIFYYDVSF